jgi:membrane protein
VPRLGAALAYYTVFSIAPLLIIAIVISGAIFGQEQAQVRIVSQIAGLIGTPGAAAVNRLINNAKLPADAGLGVTAASVGALLFGALGAFGQLQDAFDAIWSVAPAEGGVLYALRTRLIAFIMVLLVGFLLLLVMIVNTAFSAVTVFLEGRVPYFGLLSAGINLLLPVVIGTLLFAAMFKYLPRVKLTWRDVWPGAILTGLLFTLGKAVIGFYLGQSRMSTAAGAAGSVLIVLIWVYYSAQILFFGAEFTQVYVRRHRRRPVERTDEPAPAAIRRA